VSFGYPIMGSWCRTALVSLILRSCLAWQASGGGGVGENKCEVGVDWMRRKDLTCVDLSGEILGKF
jgi:hypothetical protein